MTDRLAKLENEKERDRVERELDNQFKSNKESIRVTKNY